eukprot:2757416-Pyramimonas_sp.AAC.3
MGGKHESTNQGTVVWTYQVGVDEGSGVGSDQRPIAHPVCQQDHTMLSHADRHSFGRIDG